MGLVSWGLPSDGVWGRDPLGIASVGRGDLFSEFRVSQGLQGEQRTHVSGKDPNKKVILVPVSFNTWVLFFPL